jgi:DNA-binding response OmpR family regulator
LKKILIIEDDIDTIEMVEILLQSAGYAVIKINKLITLNEIAATNPALIIVDFLLPHRLGNELCEDIKNNPATKHIPVILYSASNLLRKVAEECHADTYISKPFDLDHFLNEVNRLAL